jgi:hypothetical protein
MVVLHRFLQQQFNALAKKARFSLALQCYSTPA